MQLSMHSDTSCCLPRKDIAVFPSDSNKTYRTASRSQTWFAFSSQVKVTFWTRLRHLVVRNSLRTSPLKGWTWKTSLNYSPDQDEATSIYEATMDVRPSRTHSFPSQTQVISVIPHHRRPLRCHPEHVSQVRCRPGPRRRGGRPPQV